MELNGVDSTLQFFPHNLKSTGILLEARYNNTIIVKKRFRMGWKTHGVDYDAWPWGGRGHHSAPHTSSIIPRERKYNIEGMDLYSGLSAEN